jgi:branched-chain amino acid transport system permease protein
MNIATFTSRRFLVPGVVLLILVPLATVPLYGPGAIPLMTNFLVYIVLTVSWAMFSGPTGYISLASAAFFGTGVYASAVLFGRGEVLLPLPAVVVIGGLASFIVALLVGTLTLRLRGIYFIMFTFGLLELVRRLVQYYEFNVTGTRGRYIASVDADTVFYVMLAIFVVLMLTAYFIKRSKFGLALKSIGENEEAAAHSGVNVTMVKVITFAISAFFMGVAGVIIATRWVYIDPSIAFSMNYSFLPILMALVGGMGQLYGPVIGAVGFAYLRHLLLIRAPDYWMAIFGITLVLFIVFLPNGLVGVIQRLSGLVQKWWKGGSATQNADT